MVLEVPAWVETRATEILEQLEPESIAVYLFLRNRFAADDHDPATDKLFQFVFRSFYRVDNAGLTPQFKIRFFELMSAARSKGTADVSTIVTDLWSIPNLRAQRSIQFSFATKLGATVCSQTPIYDSEVAAVFGFRRPNQKKAFGKRLDDYLAFYSRLQATYDRILDDDALNPIRTRFRAQFRCSEEQVSEHKALDFIFWAAGRFQRKQGKEVSIKQRSPVVTTLKTDRKE
jgi:hypothetical protein